MIATAIIAVILTGTLTLITLMLVFGGYRGVRSVPGGTIDDEIAETVARIHGMPSQASYRFLWGDQWWLVTALSPSNQHPRRLQATGIDNPETSSSSIAVSDSESPSASESPSTSPEYHTTPSPAYPSAVYPAYLGSPSSIRSSTTFYTNDPSSVLGNLSWTPSPTLVDAILQDDYSAVQNQRTPRLIRVREKFNDATDDNGRSLLRETPGVSEERSRGSPAHQHSGTDNPAGNVCEDRSASSSKTASSNRQSSSAPNPN